MVKLVMSKKMVYSAVICATYSLSACGAQEIDFNGMENSEKAFNKRQHEELVILMPLETMFPDEKVRALAEAAGKGNNKKIEELVAAGVDVNATGKKNATPLFWAFRKENIKGFNKLLELGADPNIVFADGSVMHWAAGHDDIAFLKAALQHGGNPNLVAGQLGETPLFETIGIASDRKKAMYLLLASGSDINAKTTVAFANIAIGGSTPALKAAILARFDIVYELLEKGADYTIKNDSGHDLMKFALQDKNAFIPGSQQEKNVKKVIDWLAERGVSVSP